MCASSGPIFFLWRLKEFCIQSWRPDRAAHGVSARSATPPGERCVQTRSLVACHTPGAMAFARSHSRASVSTTDSSLSLSRRQSSIDSWKLTASNMRRWFAEYEEKSIRALISQHDGRSNEKILSVWKLRKTAGNWRSLILTSEAIYDATLGHRSCKRRCHLATVRAITACTASGQFLIHIDETYDALYVDRKKQAAVIDGIVQAAARFRTVEVCPS